jgi:hypothetical protein
VCLLHAYFGEEAEGLLLRNSTSTGPASVHVVEPRFQPLRRVPHHTGRHDRGRGVTPTGTLTYQDGIGSTKVPHIYLSNRPGQVRPRSSGVPVPGCDVELHGAVVSAVGGAVRPPAAA